MNFNFTDMKKLNFENLEQWPHALRWAIIALVFILVFFIGYTVDTERLCDQLDNSIAQEQNIKQQVSVAAKLLMAEKSDQMQVKQMKERFGQLLQTLPKEFNIPYLLEAISKVGNNNNLKIKLLKPSAEKKYEFYSVIPIDVKLTGGYHQLAKFVSDLANLKQPIRFTDMEISPSKINKETKNNETFHNPLQLQLIAQVYRNNIETSS